MKKRNERLQLYKSIRNLIIIMKAHTHEQTHTQKRFQGKPSKHQARSNEVLNSMKA